MPLLQEGKSTHGAQAMPGDKEMTDRIENRREREGGRKIEKESTKRGREKTWRGKGRRRGRAGERGRQMLEIKEKRQSGKTNDRKRKLRKFIEKCIA